MIGLIDVAQLDHIIREGGHLCDNHLTATLHPQGTVITLIAALHNILALDIRRYKRTLANHPIISAVGLKYELIQVNIFWLQLRIPVDDDLTTLPSANDGLTQTTAIIVTTATGND